MPNDWNFKTLKQYVDRRFKDNRDLYSQQFEAQEKAVIKAENASEKRFEGVNEFRQTLSDQQRTFMPRSEVEVIVKSLNEKVELISKKQTTNAGQRIGYSQSWAIAGVVIMAIIAVAGVFFK